MERRLHDHIAEQIADELRQNYYLEEVRADKGFVFVGYADLALHINGHKIYGLQMECCNILNIPKISAVDPIFEIDLHDPESFVKLTKEIAKFYRRAT